MNFTQSYQTITSKSIWNKTLVFLLFFIFAFAKGNAQILEPVKWTAKIEKKSGTNAVLIFDGTIEKENTWLICSNDQIVWVVGIRQDERFKIENSSNKILKIELQ